MKWDGNEGGGCGDIGGELVFVVIVVKYMIFVVVLRGLCHWNRLGWVGRRARGEGVWGSSVMGGADEESCNADCGDLKQHRFEHSWGSQQGCTKCRLRSVHRGGPYVAPRRCLASTDIFQCLSAGIRAGNQYILRKGNVHIICQLGWMDRDMKGSLES